MNLKRMGKNNPNSVKEKRGNARPIMQLESRANCMMIDLKAGLLRRSVLDQIVHHRWVSKGRSVTDMFNVIFCNLP